ncbi:MAG: hypothetical protein AB8U69_03940 [Anaplasma ovis]|uniref:Ana29 n=1 Tax=Anaplasma ovis str. Haibei TaxID=1248439 RepID=A0A2Z2L8P1_9RICK|nr:hypothetical protein [Anaplasma ovis]ASI47943.1 ana29 [Anaplasma ovis str. Haibei]
MSFKIKDEKLSAHIANPDGTRYMRQGLGVTTALSIIVVAALAARVWRLSQEGLESGVLLKRPEFIALMVMLAVFVVAAIGLAVVCNEHQKKAREMNGLYPNAAYLAPANGEEEERGRRGETRHVSFASSSRTNPFSTPTAMAGLVTLTIFAALSGALPSSAAITADMIGSGFAAATPLQQAWVVMLFLAMAVTFFAAMRGGLLASGQGNRLCVVSSGDVSAADGVLPSGALGPETDFNEVIAIHVHDAGYRGGGVNPVGGM